MGVSALPVPTDRLFFAVLPDAAAAAHIHALAGRLRHDLGLTGRPIGLSRYHVTLNFLGDHAGLPQRLVDQVSAHAATIVLPGFDVVLDHVESFARPRHSPLVLRGGGEGVAGLRTLEAALRAGLESLALADHRRYTPHLTLLRDDRVIVRRPVDPVRWRAADFALMCSRIGQGRHDVLARWPLAS